MIKNYICENHNIRYTSFCETCSENISIYCERNHNNHMIISYGKLIPDINNINNLLL